MATLLNTVNTRETGQKTKARDGQAKNNAGGYVFPVSDQQRLERFLIAGIDGGSYYVGARDNVQQHVDFLRQFIASDEAAVVKTLTEVSVDGRALKQQPTIFALACVFKYGTNKEAARAAFKQVVRTSTHLFQFVQYIDNLEGWGRAKRRAVAEWYTSKSDDALAYQVVKYRSRSV